jgi:hypothetical protein
LGSETAEKFGLVSRKYNGKTHLLKLAIDFQPHEKKRTQAVQEDGEN